MISLRVKPDFARSPFRLPSSVLSPQSSVLSPDLSPLPASPLSPQKIGYKAEDWKGALPLPSRFTPQSSVLVTPEVFSPGPQSLRPPCPSVVEEAGFSFITETQGAQRKPKSNKIDRNVEIFSGLRNCHPY